MEIEYSSHQPDDDTAHVISMILMTRPQHKQQVIEVIKQLPGSEVHGSDEQGRIVVVAEADSNFELVKRMEKLQNIEHIVSSSLVFHQIA
ncbi:MAG: hypothetical protein OFPII_18450 [Osedax symbiont Rs1]|nr:MAG: hypothetical protein OFPII_18450 [Osedax symbiont Rs1]